MTPRGIRNNNPGNIRRGATAWVGESTLQDDPSFIRFEDPLHGLRALMKLLLTYQEKYDLDTVESLINRFAPPVENATDNYIYCVSKALGVKRIDHIDLGVPDYLIRIAQAITAHENGECPDKSLPFWYPESVYESAAKMALT